uniref:hypothetical protein n=1 Tax=Variovorax sp. BK018 TaxID=3450241 RepID=UPI004039DE00
MASNQNQQGSSRGGSHEQHVKAGQQSHKNTLSQGQQEQQSGTRGGTPQQHSEAGRQSHKNS